MNYKPGDYVFLNNLYAIHTDTFGKVTQIRSNGTYNVSTENITYVEVNEIDMRLATLDEILLYKLER